MLAKNNRLTKKNDFDKIWQSGITLKSKLFLIKYRPGRMEKSRFGIVVSKKNISKATQRNKIKRRIRYIIGQYPLESNRNMDVVVITNKFTSVAKFPDLKNELVVLLSKIYRN